MKKKGFTLIELLVVVAIIGVLATVVLGALGSAKNKATDSAAVSSLKQLELALELYYLDNGEYPRAPQSYGINNAGTAYLSSQALQFASEIDPYLKGISANDFFLKKGTQWGDFYYRSTPDNNYQSYYSSVATPTRPTASDNDGGYFPTREPGTGPNGHTTGHYGSSFEIGSDGRYCREKYFSSVFGVTNVRCLLGN